MVDKGTTPPGPLQSAATDPPGPFEGAQRAVRRLIRLAENAAPGEDGFVPAEPEASGRDATQPTGVAPDAIEPDATGPGRLGGPPRLGGTVVSVASGGTGVEPPLPEWVEVSSLLPRTFAFVDVCGFTAYTDRHGPLAATELLTSFRAATRAVAVRRGVRVVKWLGDGVMIVGAEPGPVIATAAELFTRMDAEEFAIHGGVAGGDVLLFEGDDYVGRPVNIAARLCDAANPGELLVVGLDGAIPEWVESVATLSVRVDGIGDLIGVRSLRSRSASELLDIAVSQHPSDSRLSP